MTPRRLSTQHTAGTVWDSHLFCKHGAIQSTSNVVHDLLIVFLAGLFPEDLVAGAHITQIASTSLSSCVFMQVLSCKAILVKRGSLTFAPCKTSHVFTLPRRAKTSLREQNQQMYVSQSNKLQKLAT